MKIEEYIRVNGWLNIKVDHKENEPLFDFACYTDGVKHTLSEANELYHEWKTNESVLSKENKSLEQFAEDYERNKIKRMNGIVK